MKRRYSMELATLAANGEWVSSNITLENRSRNSGSRSNSFCERTPPVSV